MTAYLRVCLVVVTYLAVAASLPAAVFERDWKMPGDGLLTYDDVNQREWLDLPVSLLSQFPTPRYENAVAETAPGGVFEGFTLAKSPDVIALAESAGIDMSTIEYEVNGETISRLVGLLGPTIGSLPGFARSQGFLDERALPFPGAPSTTPVAAIFHHDPPDDARLLFTASEDLLAVQSAGLMLYRVIPEPNTICLIALMGLIVAATRMHRGITSKFADSIIRD